MANLILGLILTIMVLVSLRAIRKPHVVPHIDQVVYAGMPRRGWGVLGWLIGLIVVIVLLRLFLGG